LLGQHESHDPAPSTHLNRTLIELRDRQGGPLRV
jgi:hypothetical protein